MTLSILVSDSSAYGTRPPGLNIHSCYYKTIICVFSQQAGAFLCFDLVSVVDDVQTKDMYNNYF